MNAIKLWKEAREYILKENYDIAMTILNKALEIEPDNATILSERAVVFFHQGDKQKALLELDRCVQLEPENGYRYSSRAYIKADLRMIDEAISDYEKCVELDPEDPIAYNNLALLLESKGRMEAAKRHFSHAEKLEKMLNERGVTLPISEEEKAQHEIEETPEVKSPKQTSWSITKDVLTQKSNFKEFISFIKNGFKIDKN